MSHASTSYRIVDLSTGEIRAELEQFEQAKTLADKFAVDNHFTKSFAVVLAVTVYETLIANP